MADELDILLLRHIDRHSYQSSREIARNLGLTESTARNRLKKLETKGYVTNRTIGIWPFAYLWFLSALGTLLLRGADTSKS